MKIIGMLISLFFTVTLVGQNDTLIKFVRENYKDGTKDGVQIVETDEGAYLVSVGIVSTSDKKQNSTLMQITKMKAKSNVIHFIDGSLVTAKSIYTISEATIGNNVTYYESFFSSIKENSQGYVQGMRVLDSFYSTDNTNFILAIYKKLK